MPDGSVYELQKNNTTDYEMQAASKREVGSAAQSVVNGSISQNPKKSNTKKSPDIDTDAIKKEDTSIAMQQNERTEYTLYVC